MVFLNRLSSISSVRSCVSLQNLDLFYCSGSCRLPVLPSIGSYLAQTKTSDALQVLQLQRSTVGHRTQDGAAEPTQLWFETREGAPSAALTQTHTPKPQTPTDRLAAQHRPDFITPFRNRIVNIIYAIWQMTWIKEKFVWRVKHLSNTIYNTKWWIQSRVSSDSIILWIFWLLQDNLL